MSCDAVFRLCQRPLGPQDFRQSIGRIPSQVVSGAFRMWCGVWTSSRLQAPVRLAERVGSEEPPFQLSLAILASASVKQLHSSAFRTCRVGRIQTGDWPCRHSSNHNVLNSAAWTFESGLENVSLSKYGAYSERLSVARERVLTLLQTTNPPSNEEPLKTLIDNVTFYSSSHTGYSVANLGRSKSDRRSSCWALGNTLPLPHDGQIIFRVSNR